MSPLQIILLLRLHACAKPREDYPIEQRMAPAMKEAFARFQELGFLADGVSHASVMGEDNPYLERLSDKGLAMVERLCSLELKAAQQPAAAPVSGDVALPDLHDFSMDAEFAQRLDGLAKVQREVCGGDTAPINKALRSLNSYIRAHMAQYARTYGQQCSDAALERAAKLADDKGYGLIANRIRALKGGA